MIVELVRKEFVKNRPLHAEGLFSRLAKVFFACLFLASFIALECFTLLSLDRKIVSYSPYGSFDFLLLYQLIVLIGVMLTLLPKGRRILFAKDDNRLLTPLPLSKESIVFSKAVYLYFHSVFYLLILSTPSLICYGLGRVDYAYYFIFTFLYPLLSSFFVTGMVLFLVPLVELFYRAIKFSDLLQFFLAVISVLGLCFGYQFVLRLFLTALSDSGVGGLFSEAFVRGLHDAAKWFVPVVHILTPALESSVNALPNVCFFLGELLLAMVIGYYVSAYFYSLLNNKDFYARHNKKKGDAMKVVSPLRALLQKEFAMLFKDGNYLFSYTSLLILAPFLSFLVISSLNAIIYSNLEFFSVYFPELINGLNVALILLFLSVINSSAALSMSREGKMIQIVKYLPISPLKQISVKLLTPMALSFFSLLATLVALIAGKIIAPTVFFVSLFLGAALLFADNVLSIEWDMLDKGESKHKLSSLNFLLSLGFPILILMVHYALSFAYVPGWAIYCVEAFFGALLLLPCFIKIKSRYIKAFRGMEVS